MGVQSRQDCSDTGDNKTSRGIVLLKVTSSGMPSEYSIALTNKYTTNRALKKDSRIVVDFPVTILKQNVFSRPGRISGEMLAKVKGRIAEFYGL